MNDLRTCTTVCILCTSILLNASVTNLYAPVTAIDKCKNSITIAMDPGFVPGDQVLLIQMKGATVDLSNTGSFGTVTSYGAAGNYEFLMIEAINGNEINFTHRMLRDYDVSGLVQLVSVPVFGSLAINTVQTCPIWDGSTGGVLVFEVTGTLFLSANIDVSGRGFGGGAVLNPNIACQMVSPDYFYPTNAGGGALKGEGICTIAPPYATGRGHIANGGGGGNNHNGGGGGGGNAGAGGIGGNTWDGCPTLPYGGVGGSGYVFSTMDKIFLGGGGGAGHNNTVDNTGTPGERGGGIVIIKASALIANGMQILAEGSTVQSRSHNDGAGGGGGGGTILLDIANMSGMPSLSAMGGDGGSTHYSTTCLGPGGGGGGGIIAVSSATVTPGVNTSVQGGNNGMHTHPSSICFNSAYGAQRGQDGMLITGLVLPRSADPFEPPEVTISSTGILCFGAINGTATVHTDLLQPPLSFIWNTVPTQFTATATNLGPGTYSVTVTDRNQCTYVASMTITESSSMLAVEEVSVQHASCHGAADGSAEVTAPDGIPPYSFVWNTVPPQMQPQAIHLPAGTYTVTVTDASDCTQSHTIEITQPDAISLTLSEHTHIRCHGEDNGTAFVMASGGNPPYLYVWNTIPPINTPGANQLSGGSYTVTVTDSNACSSEISFMIDDPDILEVAVQISDVFCAGGDDGELVFTISGGNSPYLIDSGQGVHNTDILTGLSAGIYYVTVTDANGCEASLTATITEPPPLSIMLPGVFTIQFGDAVLLTNIVTGGTDPLSYVWMPDSTLSCGFCMIPSAMPPAQTLYSLTVTDAAGCMAAASTLVMVEYGENAVFVPNVFSPNGDGINDILRVCTSAVLSLRLRIFDRWGELVFETADANFGWDGTFKGQPLLPGVYAFLLLLDYPDGEKVVHHGSITLIR